MSFCTNGMWTVVPLESDGKNVAVNFLGTQFQTQEAYTNILKSGPLCSPPDKKPARKCCLLTKEKWEPCTGDQHLRINNPHLIHEVNFKLFKLYRVCYCACVCTATTFSAPLAI
jgi:hypothetical protein